jgi:hypothetical protein
VPDTAFTSSQGALARTLVSPCSLVASWKCAEHGINMLVVMGQ